MKYMLPTVICFKAAVTADVRLSFDGDAARSVWGNTIPSTNYQHDNSCIT